MNLRRCFLMTLAVIVACSLPAVSRPTDVDGWGKAKWGMTIQQVQEADPRALKSSEHKADGRGLTVRLVSAGLKAHGFPCSISYHFDSASTLRAIDLMVDCRNRDLAMAWYKLRTELVSEYGYPSENYSPAGASERPWCRWAFPATTIHLGEDGSIIVLVLRST